MSLTSHLKDTSSPVYGFFRDNFPDVGAARRVLAPTDDSAVVVGTFAPSGERPRGPMWRLGDPVVVPRSDDRSRYPFAVVGAAFDYRVRFYYAEGADDYRNALAGAVRLSGNWNSQPVPPSAFSALEARSADLRRTELVKRGDDAFERDLGAVCYALALYEQVYRSGISDERHPLVRMGPLADVEDVLSLASEPVLEDLAELSRLFVATQPSLLTSSITPNPIFIGSTYLGGADADLIADSRLLDVKTVMNSTIEQKHLWQVLGYVLCDFDDAYGIGEVGFYYSRHGVQVVWPVGDLLSLLADRRVDVSQARNEFAALLGSLSPLP